MKVFKESKKDLVILKEKYGLSFIMAIFSNRGWQSLFIYRLSHVLWKNKIPLIPMLLTRFIHIMYSIDIDYKCNIEGGVIIIHGVGLVIGKGAVVKKGTIIYHQVTLGEKGTKTNDGYPSIGEDVVLGSGAKLFGPIEVGSKSIVGANVVLTKSIGENLLIKVDFNSYEQKNVN